MSVPQAKNVICPRCSTPNPASFEFCGSCGLPLDPTVNRQVRESLPPTAGLLFSPSPIPSNSRDLPFDLSAQDQQAIESLNQIENIRAERWSELNETERLSALQDTENNMASIQGRPPAEVVKYEAGPGDYGRCDLESNRIMVGSNSLEHDDVPEVVDTVVHEGRHAYQDYAVQHPGVRSSPAEVEGCRQNSGENYSRPEENPRRYREQA